MLCVSQFTKKLHKIMINKLMIEKFKKCENIINEYDYFNFYTFNEFYCDICSFNDLSQFDDDDDLLNDVIENMKQFEKYNCNNNNSIVLLQNVDDDEYVVINFENDIIIHTQNYDIEYVENVNNNNALYDILKTLFCCEYVQH